jgi:hypothetical protein
MLFDELFEVSAKSFFGAPFSEKILPDKMGAFQMVVSFLLPRM